MFRNTARVAWRAVGSQRRMNSSAPVRESSKAIFYVAAAASAVAVGLAVSQPTQNAFFSSTPPPVDLKKVRNDIAAAIEAEDSKRGDGTSIGPTLVRFNNMHFLNMIFLAFILMQPW